MPMKSAVPVQSLQVLQGVLSVGGLSKTLSYSMLFEP